MNIINLEQVSKLFGDKQVFEGISLGIQQGDRVGVIGINGTGKSTLLKMIAGEEEPDTGSVVRQNNLKLAYLPQNPVFPQGATLASWGGEGEELWKVQSNLTRLGIAQMELPVAQLSGGQKRRAALAKVLAADADVLLLDEPTNHLDPSMIRWLEEYLRGFRGTILMVTHDRYFLDRVAGRIVEISHGQVYEYEANYSGFLELKAAREEMELAAERKRQSILRMELEWAKRGCRARSTKQRARLERLEQLKNASGPEQERMVELDSAETRMGKKTIELHHVTRSLGGRKLLDDFSYIFLKNQKVGVIGPNGCGKTTFMKLLAGELEPEKGEIQLGDTIRIGYFAQEEPPMDENMRVIDYVRGIGEYISTREGKISASQMLERFLFTPDMQYSPVGKLSGGEKRRLYLLGVLCGNINVLLLDEASNNLDIPTLTILEDYLNSFAGIVVAVSHDRYFLDNVADRILEFDGEGHIRQYEGGYSDYLERKSQETSEEERREEPGRQAQKKENSLSGRNQNRKEKLRFTFKEQKEYEAIDEEIADLEAEIQRLDGEIMKNATNSGKLNELTVRKEQTEKLLEEKMDRWVYLTDLAERIEAQKNGSPN